MRRRSALATFAGAMVAVTMSIGPVGAAETPSAGSVRAVVTFVGDANVVLGASERAIALTARDEAYAIVDLTRAGAGIRNPDCPEAPCSTFDYWQERLAEASAKVASDAYVVNLGINDTAGVGTAGGPGYAAYAGKVDWMMRLFGGKPVFWSNLPCAIEPPARAVGCAAVNAALAAAPSRWPNLTVIDWATEANSHPDYIVAQGPFRVLYTLKGHRAWATLVAAVVDAAFPATLAGRVSAAPTGGVAAGPPVITFVGDSNIAVGSTMNALAFTARDVPYTIVNLAKPSSTIRYADCPDGSCSTFDFWQTRLADGAAKVASDAYVVNLGINDTVGVGSAGGPGYAAYGGKVDWMMRLFGGKPVFWSNLPCAIEPPARAVGCAAVNAALAAAPSRWPNLTVIDWATEANSHPEYLFSAPGLGAVHYSAIGALVWASAAAGAVDAQFPAGSWQ